MTTFLYLSPLPDGSHELTDDLSRQTLLEFSASYWEPQNERTNSISKLFELCGGWTDVKKTGPFPLGNPCAHKAYRLPDGCVLVLSHSRDRGGDVPNTPGFPYGPEQERGRVVLQPGVWERVCSELAKVSNLPVWPIGHVRAAVEALVDA